MNSKQFGEFMRGLRQGKRLSLRNAAKRATISVTYLWQIEKGDRNPSAVILKKFAPVYGVTIQDLLKAAGYLEEPKVGNFQGENFQLSFEDFVRNLRDRQLQTVFRGWGKLSAAEKEQLATLVRFFEQEAAKGEAGQEE